MREKVERYGNIYFYKPIPKAIPYHQDSNPVEVFHGNNGSGKSYATGAEMSYAVTGKSPYRELPTPPTGTRVIWIITQNFDIQKDSSQTILFSNVEAIEQDIGLLPSIQTLQKYGCSIEWHKKGILRSITFPDNTRIEFKSMEQQAFSLAGAAVDMIWLDELAKANVFDEMTARVLRKYGEVHMSCLVEDVEQSYLVTDIYQKYEEDMSKYGKSKLSFYFVEVEDNTYLDPQEVKAYKELLTKEGKSWRFSKGGKFVISPKGQIVYPNYNEDIHLVDNLIDQYNPMRSITVTWDLGYNRPAYVGWQVDDYGRILCFFAGLGDGEDFGSFIDKNTGHMYGIFPEGHIPVYDLLPHDGNRHDPISGSTGADTLRDKGRTDFDVLYPRPEQNIQEINRWLNTTRSGKPMFRVDSQHANLVANCLAMYTRDEVTGKPKTGKKTNLAHISDAMKIFAEYYTRKMKPREQAAEAMARTQSPQYASKIERIQPEGLN